MALHAGLRSDTMRAMMCKGQSRGSAGLLRTLFILLCALLAVGGLGGGAWRIATEGPGVLGVNNAVPWGWDIVQFVFWIGLGHAGTLISAILLLTRQRWRLPVARHAELMTLCAVVTAAVFPLVHVGRIWMIWLLSPLPVASGVWPDLSSPLVWDALAVSSYLLLSFLYWRTGMLGERLCSVGQRRVWARACLLLAGILTPLVVSVHSIVGSDFAVTLRWSAALLPPYFVCGALLSGMAMVMLIALARRVADGVLERLALLTLSMAMAMGLFYALELAGHPGLFDGRYAGMLLLNVGLPALLWLPSLRRRRAFCALAALGVLVGMWLERVQIIVGRSVALTGGSYSPSATDAAMLTGSIGLFLALYLSISRRMPEERVDPLDELDDSAALPALTAGDGGPAGGSGGSGSAMEVPAARRATRPATACGCAPAAGEHSDSGATAGQAGKADRTSGAQGTVALLGGAAGALLVLLWGGLTQWADLAGALDGVPTGPLFHIPGIFVASLLGAGLATVLHLHFLLKRYE